MFIYWLPEIILGQLILYEKVIFISNPKKTRTNYMRFLTNFLRDAKNGKKDIAIITDKDGTIVLNYELKVALESFKRNYLRKVWIIANSGRTVGDMVNCLEENNIPVEYFDYILGDNGNDAYDVGNKQEMFKHCLPTEIIKDIVEEFLALGGTLADVRFANGSQVIAYDDEQVREYYANRGGIEYYSDIDISQLKDITKLSLTCSNVKGLEKYITIKYPEYKLQEFTSKFLEKTGRKGYGLDFTGAHTKGTATQYMLDELNIGKAIVLGNDKNDLEMFKVALKRGDYVAVVDNDKPNVTDNIFKELEKYAQEEKIDWEKAKILWLPEVNVSDLLKRIALIIKVIEKTPQSTSTRAQDFRNGLQVTIEPNKHKKIKLKKDKKNVTKEEAIK